MKAWFAGLEQREQLSLLLLALAVGLYVLFMVLLNPLASSRDALMEQNQRVAESLARVDMLASQVAQLRGSGASGSTPQRNLTALVNRTTAASGLQVTRLQPNSRGEIQVRLENASFDDVMSWLHEVEYRHALLVREVSLSQSGAAGRVNATVRIAQGA